MRHKGTHLTQSGLPCGFARPPHWQSLGPLWFYNGTPTPGKVWAPLWLYKGSHIAKSGLPSGFTRNPTRQCLGSFVVLEPQRSPDIVMRSHSYNHKGAQALPCEAPCKTTKGAQTLHWVGPLVKSEGSPNFVRWCAAPQGSPDFAWWGPL
jgi:hypothetical protein